ncbi:MAG: 3-deoxy-7-phosphoheptulonate synthase class II [Deltaproteobacteria bacterium]|nr:MAG: 3-deoxy-7-phosphoheptulonate synthase class II [Deltaproteobacteria bacterium]
MGPMSEWSPTSWREKRALQQPAYPDAAAVDRVVAEIAKLPPLVTSWEVEQLKSLLARAARGDAFVLQGGDCAESFDECDSSAIAAKLKILLQMSLVLIHATHKPVVRIGRIAGQYAKPRSKDTETRDGVELPSYRGDLVNRSPFTAADRTPDPTLLLRGYERAALTLNFIRALADGGFADLHHTEYWDLGFARDAPARAEYEQLVESIRDSLVFMETVAGVHIDDMRRVDFYTSHEGLSLLYEQAQTRRVPRREGWYNLSTHFPWIGMRTAQVDGAHVEFFRGIRNPIAVKIGPGMTREWLTELIRVLNPDDEPGRLTLIHRLGADRVEHALPPLIEAVQAAGATVTWLCDPMHGNTETTADGIKTRRFDNILAELERSFDVHARSGTVLGGVHFELTGEDVTECIGGARGLSEADLKRAYRSQVDPRLNYEQSLEMALRIATKLKAARRARG